MPHTIVLLSDIHANAAALDAVLKDARTYVTSVHNEAKMRVWCLGDLIGRGPEARLLVSLQRLYEQASEQDKRWWLAGNHDWMVLDRISTQFLETSLELNSQMATLGGMEPEASNVACYHRINLDQFKPQLDWLRSLPVAQHHDDFPHLYAAHGQYYVDADGRVNEDRAVETYGNAPQFVETFNNLRKSGHHLHVHLSGHTHNAGVWVWDENQKTVTESGLLPNAGSRLFTDLAAQPVFVNPGSVGFPRAPLSCPTYAVLQFDDSLNSLSVELRSVAYDYTENDFPKSWSYPQKYLKEMQGCGSL